MCTPSAIRVEKNSGSRNPPSLAAKARNRVPSSARAMPTEPMIRYFQVASMDRRLWLK